MEKAEEKIPPRVAAIPITLVLNKPQSNKLAEEECRLGLHCPICTKSALDPKVDGTEDWKVNRQENQQRNHYCLSSQHSPHMTFLIDFPNSINWKRNGMS